MFCKHCNASLDNESKFCSYCGCEVIKSKDMQAGAQAKKGNFWVKLLISSLVIVSSISLGIALFTVDPADTIQDQISTLRSQHYTEAYYNYTSKAFQDSVSLDSFRSFFSKYPIFSTSGTMKILGEKIEENISTIEAVLLSPTGAELPVQYRLIKEGDKWKILSIKFEGHEAGQQTSSAFIDRYKTSRYEIAEATPPVAVQSNDSSLFDPKPLYEVVQKHVSEVKSGNIDKAYNVDTSSDFRKSTTLDVFRKFIKAHPGFVDNKTIEFEKIAVENNVVSLTGTLTTKDNHVYPFSYSLIFEDGAWKVLHIEVFAENSKNKSSDASKSANSSNFQFEKFSLGTTVNSEGLITDPKERFNPASGQIHLNLYLKNAIAGSEVEVEFQHLESGSKAPIAVAKVPDNGDLVLSFAFTPPTKGWPKGNYKIEAKSSTNAHGNVIFKVE